METVAFISDELAQFLESGLSIVVATRDGDLQPDGASAWAARVHDDRTHLTVYLYEEAAARMLRNLNAYPQIALDFDRPTTHRACQVKGVYLSARPAEAAERALVDQQVGAFAADLDEIGIPGAML
ncbi:MAG: pyridoxamine 5'-phosphate oxidase family protein, partial [Gemmatimonadota bacterium]